MLYGTHSRYERAGTYSWVLMSPFNYLAFSDLPMIEWMSRLLQAKFQLEREEPWQEVS